MVVVDKDGKKKEIISSPGQFKSSKPSSLSPSPASSSSITTPSLPPNASLNNILKKKNLFFNGFFFYFVVHIILKQRAVGSFDSKVLVYINYSYVVSF